METKDGDKCGSCGASVGPNTSLCPNCFAQRIKPTVRRKIGGCLLAITLLIPAVAWLAAAISASWRSEREATCKTRVQQIGVFREMYKKKFGGEPAELRNLYEHGFAVDPNVFVCPVTDNRLTDHTPSLSGHWSEFSQFIGYEYRNAAAAPAAQPFWLVAWDKVAHPDGRRCVLYLDGTIGMVDERTFVKLRDAK
ncbi:MAG: hypothetical protein FD180_2376 [Planctomycetota bacterium]|nr:MAG: hypothetical protein FD180_2376 [Planctomycetota bacterium]